MWQRNTCDGCIFKVAKIGVRVWLVKNEGIVMEGEVRKEEKSEENGEDG